MSDHGRTDKTLTLLARPGVYEVLHAMQTRDGTATFAEIRTAARQPLALLRALAAEGFVRSYRSGSLDIEPCEGTHFYLTAKGEAVTGHLVRLQEWVTNHPTRRGSRGTVG